VDKYGPRTAFSVGSMKFVVLSDPEDVKVGGVFIFYLVQEAIFIFNSNELNV